MMTRKDYVATAEILKYASDKTEAYLIGIDYRGSIKTQYATIAVKVGE